MSILSDDDIDDLVADETEYQSRPSLINPSPKVKTKSSSTTQTQMNKNVVVFRKSTTSIIPSMQAVPSQEIDKLSQKTGQPKGPISLKQLLGGIKISKGSISPDPIKRRCGLLEMRGGLLNGRISPMMKKTIGKLQEFNEKQLARSPLKIASTAQLYKADTPFNLSPRRTKPLDIGSENCDQ